MRDESVDATGLIFAPIDLVRDLVGHYVSSGNDRYAMRHTVTFVLSVLVERTLTAQLTNSPCIQFGDCSLTLNEANARIGDLRTLPLF